MRILYITFYLRPDLSAGAFRNSALLHELRTMLPENASIDVMTTTPNRYQSFNRQTDTEESSGQVNIFRIPVPLHKAGVADQARTFLTYAWNVLQRVRGVEYDLIFVSTGRMMSSMLAAALSRGGRIPLYVDFRDIFVDTVKDVFRGPHVKMLLPIFSLVESYIMQRARKVNLVSPGFEQYFRSRYPQMKADFFTNGIDSEFVKPDWKADWEACAADRPQRRIRVLYAGNIGHGQGLHLIIPELARATAETHEFTVVGDGGARKLLDEALEKCGQTQNVTIVDPLARDELMEFYRKADVLFFHLNDVPAFEKVLPSKVFECAATGRPILAGVAGYARTFTEAEVLNSAVFPPCDLAAGLKALLSLKLEYTDRCEFNRKFLRNNIMHSMAASVLATARTT